MTTSLEMTLAAPASSTRHANPASVKWGRLLVHATMVLLCVIAVFPIYWMVASSFKAENEIFSLDLWPQSPSLDNYRFVLNQIPMLRMLANTTIVAGVTAALHVVTGLFAAYALVRWRFPFARVVYGLIALSWLVPFQVTMIPNYVLASKLGLLDTLAGLIIPHAAAAFAVLMLFQAMKSFPTEIIEAARMDGAGHWRILWDIITPNLRASLASLAILAFISAWNEYFWPLLLSRSIENSVVQIGLQMFMTQEGNLWGPLMAASTLASLPILLVYGVLQRQVIESFMKSGLR
ncbi:carbohydrate ABC transporter permease [Microvirga antarctica]|uniref:carbohydrate ABC transporter permease n=1 Tax=Microvirga antarctica TaxID=2819233 RepID=UPI001B313A47|nr:carbohydrate ABC transporter permease [Microvirga antarctica]